MKTGAIFYVTGEHPPKEGMEAMEIARKLGIQADEATLVSLTEGYEDIIDAWWMLLTKGMKRVVCFVVSTGDGKNFELGRQPLRLCG